MQAVRIMLKAIAVIFVMLLAGYPTASSGMYLYLDIVGHPSERVLKQAAGDGLIDDIGGYLYPDEYLSDTQVSDIINRFLGAGETSAMPRVDGLVTRRVVHSLMTFTFALTEQELNMPITGRSADEQITRAEFLTVLYNSMGDKLAPDAGAKTVVDTLVVSDGGGDVNISGIALILLTGDGRHVTMTGDAEMVAVSGQGCTVLVGEGVRVGSILLDESAEGCKVTVDGAAGRINVQNNSSTVEGSGFAGILQLAYPETPIRIAYDTLAESGDLGLLTASIDMDIPPVLPAGEVLTASVSISDVIHGKVCTLTWYVDDAVRLSKTIRTGDALPELYHRFSYSREMPGSADVKVEISYAPDEGDRQILSAETAVILENFDKRHWVELAAPGVLEKVTDHYDGDRTLEWAEENDYDSFEKEVWVNAKGYESETEYLIWVNLTYQRCNIFARSEDGLWELIRSSIIASGRGGRTPRGVTSTSLKSERGWIFDYYRVKPVTYFYGLRGYGFHSRLYRHNMADFYDSRIGFPISDGCIRMYDEDAWYIYDEIPIGTTVVIH